MENKIQFCTTDSTLHSTWVMRITEDRRIEVNEDVEVTEAAKKVLEALQPLLIQRTWVGLTNNEVNNLAAGCHLGNSVQDAIYKAEAKLKEKNT